jgi:hypothetical protein
MQLPVHFKAYVTLETYVSAALIWNITDRNNINFLSMLIISFFLFFFKYISSPFTSISFVK